VIKSVFPIWCAAEPPSVERNGRRHCYVDAVAAFVGYPTDLPGPLHTAEIFAAEPAVGQIFDGYA